MKGRGRGSRVGERRAAGLDRAEGQLGRTGALAFVVPRTPGRQGSTAQALAVVCCAWGSWVGRASLGASQASDAWRARAHPARGLAMARSGSSLPSARLILLLLFLPLPSTRPSVLLSAPSLSCGNPPLTPPPLPPTVQTTPGARARRSCRRSPKGASASPPSSLPSPFRPAALARPDRSSLSGRPADHLLAARLLAGRSTCARPFRPPSSPALLGHAPALPPPGQQAHTAPFLLPFLLLFDPPAKRSTRSCRPSVRSRRLPCSLARLRHHPADDEPPPSSCGATDLQALHGEGGARVAPDLQGALVLSLSRRHPRARSPSRSSS